MPISEAAVEAVGGAVGSVLAVAVTYPLTTISTWQALNHKEEGSKQEGGKRQLPTPLRELRMYSQTKGWAALFAGVRPTLAATAVSQGAYFYMYSALRQAVVSYIAKRKGASGGLSSRSADIGVLGSILVASLAGCGNVLVTNPVWVVAMQVLANERHSSPEKRNLSTMQVVRRVYQESGLAGFWKGLLPAMVMVLNPTLQYIMYEWLTARLLELRRASAAAAGAKRRQLHLTTGDVFVLTALAKMGATLLTYPMLLVKSRLQAMNKATEREAQYKGVSDAVGRILEAEGFKGFFKGMKIKMMQTVLSAALLMAIKEQVYLGTRRVLLLPSSSK